MTTHAKHFSSRRWALGFLAIPIAGLAARALSGPVDAVDAALLGGVLTGAGVGAAQWFAARAQLGNGAAWVASSAVGYGAGLTAGAALVGYGTGLGDLAAMGAVSGVFLGVAQGLTLAVQGRLTLARRWAAAMPAMLAVGWSVTQLAGIDVDRQFTLFGASGAIVFTVLSGVLLARAEPTS